MSKQLALADAAGNDDPFAMARALHPAAKLVRVIDPQQGEFTYAIPPTSDWFELLPLQQTVTLERHVEIPANATWSALLELVHTAIVNGHAAPA